MKASGFAPLPSQVDKALSQVTYVPPQETSWGMIWSFFLMGPFMSWLKVPWCRRLTWRWERRPETEPVQSESRAGTQDLGNFSPWLSPGAVQYQGGFQTQKEKSPARFISISKEEESQNQIKSEKVLLVLTKGPLGLSKRNKEKQLRIQSRGTQQPLFTYYRWGGGGAGGGRHSASKEKLKGHKIQPEMTGHLQKTNICQAWWHRPVCNPSYSNRLEGTGGWWLQSQPGKLNKTVFQNKIKRSRRVTQWQMLG